VSGEPVMNAEGRICSLSIISIPIIWSWREEEGKTRSGEQMMSVDELTSV
jgi:hypothetical protein